MPTRTLVSFLGKPQHTGGQYREACYVFENGSAITTSFFGLALLHVLQPDRVVFLGTPGSMWDVFVEHQDMGTEAEQDRLALMEAVANQRVTQRHLDALTPLVARCLRADCRLELIPHGRTEAEQRDILAVLARTVGQNDTVALDLTHGLRHLPLISFVSALYLQVIRHATIEALYYGALDLTDEQGRTPVLRLDGLWQLTRWLTTLHAFDKDQDYAVFAPLLQECGISQEAVHALSDAAFYERTMRITEARRPLQTFWRLSPHPFPSPADLIEPVLNDRTAWRDSERLYERQQHLAFFYLENRDYLRSVIFALEGYITSLMGTRFPNKDPQNYEHRHKAKERYEDDMKAQGEEEPHSASPEWTAYCRLRAIRNTLVHATRPTRAEEQAILQHEHTLHDTLVHLYRQLFPEHRHERHPTRSK